MPNTSTFQQLSYLLRTETAAAIGYQNRPLLKRLESTLRHCFPNAPDTVGFYQTGRCEFLCTTQSSAWAAKILTCRSRLLAALPADYVQEATLRVRVIPEAAMARYPVADKAHVSPNASQCVEDLANHVDDSGLKNTLRKLSKTLSSKA